MRQARTLRQGNTAASRLASSWHAVAAFSIGMLLGYILTSLKVASLGHASVLWRSTQWGAESTASSLRTIKTWTHKHGGRTQQLAAKSRDDANPASRAPQLDHFPAPSKAATFEADHRSSLSAAESLLSEEERFSLFTEFTSIADAAQAWANDRPRLGTQSGPRTVSAQREEVMEAQKGSYERRGKDGRILSSDVANLPASVVEASSDLYFRRLWGNPTEDVSVLPRALVAIAAGVKQKHEVDAMLQKFPEELFSVVIFHYDGRVSEWSDLPWYQRAVHISARKQSKWWFAKRFLHPDIVAPYDYIFIWDEDLDLTSFTAERYLDIVRKYDLQISQPAIDVSSYIQWPITKRQHNGEVHFRTNESRDWGRNCTNGSVAKPCAGFVEIMAPVFARKSWRCVWYMIQNDLVHGWGLDFHLTACVDGLPHEKIGVVDAQWVIHRRVPSLISQGASVTGQLFLVRQRCELEWRLFNLRWHFGLLEEEQQGKGQSGSS